MIPTNAIEALRHRAQVALNPLPYQQARLLPKLRQDRPLRFAVMTERPDVLAELLREVHATATCDAPLVPFVGLIHDLGPATAHEREMQLPARWPAGQIVELCDAVLRQRPTSGYCKPGTKRGNMMKDVMAKFAFKVDDGALKRMERDVKAVAENMHAAYSAFASLPLFDSPRRPMAKVGALDGVRVTHGRDATREVLADFTDQVEPPASFFGVDYAAEPDRAIVSTFTTTDGSSVLVDVQEVEPEEDGREALRREMTKGPSW